MTAIYRRPFDLALVVFFSISVLYGVLFSLPEGLGVPVAADSPWPPLRALHGWAIAEEPAHLDPPPNLVAACLRPLGLVYAGAATTNMFFYFTQTFLGPQPPPNVAYYLAFNLPWLIAPLALGARVLLGRDLDRAAAQQGAAVDGASALAD